MSKNLFLVEATPANENFHPIYVKADSEELARRLFCEYYSIPSSRRNDGICKVQPIEILDIPAGQKVIEEGTMSTIKTEIKNG